MGVFEKEISDCGLGKTVCHFEYRHSAGAVLSGMTLDFRTNPLYLDSVISSPIFSGARNLIALCLLDFSVAENIIIHAKRLKGSLEMTGLKFDIISREHRHMLWGIRIHPSTSSGQVPRPTRSPCG